MRAKGRWWRVQLNIRKIFLIFGILSVRLTMSNMWWRCEVENERYFLSSTLKHSFGKSDHDSILLLTSYRHKLKQDLTMTRTIQGWSDQSESTLQDCFAHGHCEMFRTVSENNIDPYADSVSEFLRKCIDDVVPTIKTYPKQNHGWLAAFAQTESVNHLIWPRKEDWHMAEYKHCSYSIRKAIKQAKCWYWEKVAI
jgi:hypothetical protein